MADLTTLKALLFDTGGVLYHRPRENAHLKAFLAEYDLTLRPRSVMERALRAATFDAQTGRISCEMFYDGILRLNGIREHQELFEAGREAIHRDTLDIVLFPGVPEVLRELGHAGLRLGVISDSAYSANEKVEWLASRGIAPDIWDVFVVSVEVGMTKVYPDIFFYALERLQVPPEAAGFVGHATSELDVAREVGLTTIAFLPDDYAVDADYVVGSFFQLAEVLLPPT